MSEPIPTLAPLPPARGVNIVSREEIEKHYVTKDDLSDEIYPLKLDIVLVKNDMSTLKTGQENMDKRFDTIETKLDEFMFTQLTMRFIKTHWKGIATVVGSLITIVAGVFGASQV